METINEFHKECALNFIDDDEFDPNGLINMDETSIYIDKPSNYTYHNGKRGTCGGTDDEEESIEAEFGVAKAQGVVKAQGVAEEEIRNKLNFIIYSN